MKLFFIDSFYQQTNKMKKKKTVIRAGNKKFNIFFFFINFYYEILLNKQFSLKKGKILFFTKQLKWILFALMVTDIFAPTKATGFEQMSIGSFCGITQGIEFNGIHTKWMFCSIPGFLQLDLLNEWICAIAFHLLQIHK